MIRVLHIGEYVQGGVATYIGSILNLAPDDVEEYLILSREKSNLSWDLPDSHIRYYSYQRGVRGVIHAAQCVQEYIREIQPDILYCHSTWAGVIGRFPYLLKHKEVKIIYNAHGWSFLRNTSGWKKQIYAGVERLLYRVTDCVINVSQYEYRAALHYGLPEERQQVIYSGVPDDARESIDSSPYRDDGKIHLLFVGRFDPQKGIDFLISQMNAYEGDNLHLYVIGDGVISSGIRKENTDRVTFLGWVPHEKLAAYYQNADAVVMPSRWEAFGLVAVEAMKYAKPVIVSNRGALPELVQDGVNGYVFDFDKPETLQDIFQSLDASALKKLGQTARSIYEAQFKADSMRKETYQVYTI